MAGQQIQNDPIYSLPYLYIQGMNLSVASTTLLAIAPGQCRDSNDVIDMPIGYPNLQGTTNPPTLFQGYIPPLYVNTAINGANGLDSGTIAASTQYAVYVIGDSRGNNQVAGLLSLTSNAYPLVPTGYDSLRLIGFVATDSSSHLLATSLLNSSKLRAFYLQPPVSVLSAGTATTFTAIDLSGAIPTTTDLNVIAYLYVVFIPAAAGDLAELRPTGSTATTGLTTITGAAAGVPQSQYVQVICGVGSSKPEIDYLVSSSSDSLTISVAGYSYTTT